MNIISSVVGTVLLIAAFTLAYLSSNNGEALLAQKDAIVMQYVDKSNEALEQEELKAAIKYAKLAMQADPKNKNGFDAYDRAMEVKYDVESTDQQSSPANEDEESEDGDMGC